MQLQQKMQESLKKAGIAINGNNPWDIQIHDKRFYQRVFEEGSLGLGESYMDKWWDSGQLDQLFFRICRSTIFDWYLQKSNLFLHWIQAFILNMQSKRRSSLVAQKHYDLGNDLFEGMLDKRMTYSCAYWKNAANLNEAQEAKLELICKKMELQPGMSILDIGCGWGSFAKYAAERYRVNVTGITISKEQLQLAQQLCQGLPIELHLTDYRDITGRFDRIVSVGQIEHVGYKNYKNYFSIISNCLKEDGLFLLHTIGNNLSSRYGDAWITKYIFPNGMTPSIEQLAAAFEGKFVMEDWHNFGPHYDKTLISWHHNFTAHWPKLQLRYDERFYRMWNYYLLSCAGAFRARQLQLWQIVLSKRGVLGGYASYR